MNNLTLIGRTTSAIELKQTTAGKSVATFTLAVKRPFTKDVTDFIPVVVWNQPAEFLGKYAHKGSKVAVSGRLTSRKWEDKEGNKRTTYEVVAENVEICESARENATEAKNQPSTYVPDAYVSPAMFEAVETDSDLPFN